MKRSISVLTTICFVLFCSSCNKSPLQDDKDNLIQNDGQNITSKTFKARLITSFCAYNIVQIQDSAYYQYGMEWTNSVGKTYKNVFSVSNFCDFGTANLKVDEIFSCKIVEKATVENCNVCMGFMETPPIRYNVQVVK